MHLCDITWDVFILYLDQGEGSFQRFPLSLLHSDNCCPTGQGPKVEFTSTAKYVDSNYTFRDWGNDYWKVSWTQDHCGLDLNQDTIYHLAPINPHSVREEHVVLWVFGLSVSTQILCPVILEMSDYHPSSSVLSIHFFCTTNSLVYRPSCHVLVEGAAPLTFLSNISVVTVIVSL